MSEVDADLGQIRVVAASEADPGIQTRIDQIAADSPGGRGSLIGLLQQIQSEFNYVPPEALQIVARALDLPLTQVCSVATFYSSFSLEPRGRHVVTCCLGTACHVRGGARLVEDLSNLLAIAPGDTTEDGLFTLETVRCLGACALAPVVVIDGKYYPKAKPLRIRRLLRKMRSTESESVT